MVHLYLARHGSTPWNRQGRWQGHTDIALDDGGRDDAYRLAERLREHPIATVVTSDLLRARETAEIVARKLGLPAIGAGPAGAVRIDPDLRERNFGIFEGLTQHECETRYPDIWARYQATRESPPGAEPFPTVIERVVRAVLRAGADLHDAGHGAGLAVSHGGSIRGLVLHVTGTLPPPVANGGLWRARIDGGTIVAVEPVEAPGPGEGRT